METVKIGKNNLANCFNSPNSPKFFTVWYVASHIIFKTYNSITDDIIMIYVMNSCNISMSDTLDAYTQNPRVYISGKSQVHMFQPICNIVPYTVHAEFFAVFKFHEIHGYQSYCEI